jgi:hypothetical protein
MPELVARNYPPDTATAIDFSASGDNTVVPAILGKRIKVFSLFLDVATATVLRFKSSSGANLSGGITMLAAGSIVLDDKGQPWFTTGVGEAFVINSTNAVQVGGTVYTTADS